MHIWMQKSASIQLQTSSLKLAAQPAISCTFAYFYLLFCTQGTALARASSRRPSPEGSAAAASSPGDGRG